MEITLMTVVLLLLAALIATAIRLYDFPVTKVTKETILDAVKVFVYALIAAFLSLYLLELVGLTLDLENFGFHGVWQLPLVEWLLLEQFWI